MTKPIEQARGARPPRKPTPTGDLLGANAEIARKLKEYYDELLAQYRDEQLAPQSTDRFAEQLDRLEQMEQAARAAATTPSNEG
jgi:hypothetical protein